LPRQPILCHREPVGRRCYLPQRRITVKHPINIEGIPMEEIARALTGEEVSPAPPDPPAPTASPAPDPEPSLDVELARYGGESTMLPEDN